jgi:hypothetical protein
MAKAKKEKVRFIKDSKGRVRHALMSVEEYRQLVEDLHDLRKVLERKEEALISLEEVKKELNV